MVVTKLPPVIVAMNNNDGVLLFVMEGLLSRLVFESLLADGTRFNGIVLPGRSAITQQLNTQNSLDVLNTDSIESMARFHQIPLFYVSGKDPQQYQQAITQSQPDIVIVACFPYRLPAVVFQHPAKGAYNVHPSLLPAYRGPMPLFWQFYYGDINSGISIHEIDEGLDTGNIVLQQQVTLSDGISAQQATKLLARAAVDQLRLLLASVSSNRLPAIAQNEQASSYYSWPGLAQFTIEGDWQVRRAFNFIHGTMHWQQAYKIISNNKETEIRKAIDYSMGSCRHADFSPTDSQYLIQFSDGCLLASA